MKYFAQNNNLYLVVLSQKSSVSRLNKKKLMFFFCCKVDKWLKNSATHVSLKERHQLCTALYQKLSSVHLHHTFSTIIPNILLLEYESQLGFLPQFVTNDLQPDLKQTKQKTVCRLKQSEKTRTSDVLCSFRALFLAPNYANATQLLPVQVEISVCYASGC